MHDEKTRDLPGLLEDPAKATITKIQGIKEPAPRISSRDPEEENSKANQGQPVSSKPKATSESFGLSRLHYQQLSKRQEAAAEGYYGHGYRAGLAQVAQLVRTADHLDKR